MKVDRLLEMIEGGELDDHLDSIVNSLRKRFKSRQDEQARKIWAELEVGTKVRLVGNRKPAYLTGLTGTIDEFRSTRVIVKLDRGPVGKFKSGRVICSPAGLEVIHARV